MKKLLLFFWLLLTQSSISQSIEWLRLFDVHSQNALGGLSKNTIKDEYDNLISPVVEGDILKIYRFDAQGNEISLLNTQRTCGQFSPITKVSPGQYAIVFDTTPSATNAHYKLLYFNSDFEILQELELDFPISGFFTFSSFFAHNGSLYFTVFTDTNQLIYTLNSANELVLKHTATVANAYTERIKALSNGNFIIDYGERLNHQLRCISPQTGQLIWTREFVNTTFNTYQLDYRTILGENQTIYHAGLERTWVSGVANDVIKFRAIHTENGNLIQERTFSLTDGGTDKIDDLRYNPVNQHLYVSYLSNGTIEDEVVIELDLNFNLVHQARLAYTYDSLSAWVNSKIVIRDNGGLIFIYTNYKNEAENGNLHIVNMNADLSINGALELNIAPKNSSEAFSHAFLYDQDRLFITGYVPNANPMIGFEEVQYYLAMVNVDRLLNTENPNPTANLVVRINPATETLVIDENMAFQNVAFFDTLGKLIRLDEFASNTYDISGLSSGIYIIQAIDQNGQTLHGKFIKD